MADEKDTSAGGAATGKGGSAVKAAVIAVVLVAVLFGVLAVFSNVSDLMLFDY